MPNFKEVLDLISKNLFALEMCVFNLNLKSPIENFNCIYQSNSYGG